MPKHRDTVTFEDLKEENHYSKFKDIGLYEGTSKDFNPIGLYEYFKQTQPERKLNYIRPCNIIIPIYPIENNYEEWRKTCFWENKEDTVPADILKYKGPALLNTLEYHSIDCRGYDTSIALQLVYLDEYETVFNNLKSKGLLSD